MGMIEHILEIVLRIDSRQEQQNKLLQELLNKSNIDSPEWLDVKGLCEYHPEHPKPTTVYSWVHNSIIPFHKKGKRLLFLKSDIDLFLKEGYKKSPDETAQFDIENFINKNTKK